MAFLTLTTFVSLLVAIQANPLVEPRAVCNMDNCYRQVSRQFLSNYPSASAQCSSYGNTRPTQTSYRTATTITIKNSGLLGSQTVFAGPSPFWNNPTTYQAPTFATACPSTGSMTQTVNRFQSACACLTNAGVIPSPTTTRSGNPVNTVACDPANNYGVGFNDGQFGVFPFPFSNPGSIRSKTNYNNILDVGACCRKCFQTPGCLKFQFVAPGGTTGSSDAPGCNIIALEKSKNTFDDPICPFGLDGDYTPSYGDYGNGPCRYELESDE